MSARRQVRLQPALGRGFRQRHHREGGRVDLRGGLQRVAAIDHDCRLVPQHQRDAGRAGEAGQPGEALVAGRDIFVLVRVGAGDKEAVEPASLQFLAQQLQAGRAERGSGGIGEGLELGVEHDGPWCCTANLIDQTMPGPPMPAPVPPGSLRSGPGGRGGRLSLWRL